VPFFIIKYFVPSIIIIIIIIIITITITITIIMQFLTRHVSVG